MDQNSSTTAALTTADIAAFIAQLAMASPAGDDPERIDRITVLEALKAAAAAAQAHDLVAFADSQVADQAAKGVKARDRGSGIAAQVGLATRNSPHRGGRMLATLSRELHRRDGRYGLETMCIGGGQGLAAIFEAVK